MVKIHRSVMVDQKHVDWLDAQPRTFNFSEECRKWLDSLMKTASNRAKLKNLIIYDED